MEASNGSGGLGWRRRLGFILILLLSVSVGARMTIADDKNTAEQSAAPLADGTTALVPQDADPQDTQPKEPSGLEKVLPFVTEGALAMLLGLATGIATRLVMKMVVLTMLLFFLATQFLAYKGLLTVDWGTFWTWLRDSVLNISEAADVSSLLQHKLPSVGAFLLGYLLGLKRR